MILWILDYVALVITCSLLLGLRLVALASLLVIVVTMLLISKSSRSLIILCLTIPFCSQFSTVKYSVAKFKAI